MARLDGRPRHRAVAVVGAGPVGLATALGLARRGVAVTVVEAGDGVSHGSRAICISRHSLEILDRLGAGDAVQQEALPWIGGRSYFREHEILSFRMPETAHDVRPPMVNISQGVLEQLLVDVAEESADIEILWGLRATGVDVGDNGVTLTVESVEGTRTLEADWVVAADGARSVVRGLLGLSMRGTSYEGRYVIADIHMPTALSSERRVWFHPQSAPDSTIIMHRQPGDIWRVDYQLRPDEDAERELAGERIHERIDRHLSWLGLDDPWTLEWSSLYRAHAISLDDYVHGRVVFAGDAAHLVPIFGVRGLNSGFEDADTLAWQLGAVVHGTALPALLAAYSTERREAWAQNISSAEKSTRIMSPQHVGEVATRDALLELAVHEPAFRALMDPRQSTATNAHRSPISWAGLPGSAGARPGDPLVDQAVDVADAEGTRESALFAEFGDGFAVVGVDVAPSELAPIVDRIAAELGPEPVRAVHLTTAENGPGVRLRDRDIVLGRPGDVLVVRPDGLVLCRVPQTGRERLGALGVELGRGMAPGPVRIEPAVAGPDLPMEHVWSSLSASLGQARDPQAFLTRLALSLGLQVGEEAWVRALHLAEVAESDDPTGTFPPGPDPRSAELDTPQDLVCRSS